jgi:putative transcriptional regulator
VNDVPDISQLIQEFRSYLGLTQSEFAARLGVTFPTVNRWERKRAKPSKIALRVIQAELNQLGEKGEDLLSRYFPS